MQVVATQEEPITTPFVAAPGVKARGLPRLRAALFKPVDISFLVFFRILFGGIMLWEVYRYFTYGWISRYFVEPAVNFPYYGFSWVQPWSGDGMYIHFFVLGLAAACILAGFAYRIAVPVFFLGYTYFFLLDQTRYLNHFYLVCLISFLMCFLPAERAFSVDALLRKKIHSDVVPAWTLWLLRIQVGIPFFYGGIAKLNGDWIHGGEPMRTWLRPLSELPRIGYIFAADWLVYSFVFGGLLLDLLVVPLLLWRRTRPVAFAAAVVFNLINAVIFNIGIFPWFMLGALFIFFPPDFIRRVARSFLPPEEELTDETQSQSSATPGRIPESNRGASLTALQKVAAGVLAAFLVVQIFLPLRHHLYPGDVSWTEEGHNFSWHMKLRAKAGKAVFTITHPRSGQTWVVKPEDHLKSHQLTKVVTKPDLLILFAHYLADEKRREGYDDVEVRANVMVSLNGRKPQLLIDPDIDLAKEQVSLSHTRWIVPLTTPLEGSAAQDYPLERP